MTEIWGKKVCVYLLGRVAVCVYSVCAVEFTLAV